MRKLKLKYKSTEFASNCLYMYTINNIYNTKIKDEITKTSLFNLSCNIRNIVNAKCWVCYLYMSLILDRIMHRNVKFPWEKSKMLSSRYLKCNMFPIFKIFKMQVV